MSWLPKDRIRLIIAVIRPRHWVKNLFVFAGLFFSMNLGKPHLLWLTLQGFLCWCLASSSGYILNDCLDKEEDLQHPVKRNRPIASGAISIKQALAIMAVSAVLSLLWAFSLQELFGMLLFVYLVLNFFYSFRGKHLFLIDVMCISAGFVLRVISGAELIKVGFSVWMVMCTMLLSLFLGFGKRQHELVMLKDNAGRHRRVLDAYTEGFLEHVPYLLTPAAIVCYMLYTVAAETVAKFGTRNLIYTTPLVIYGLMRYLFLVYEDKNVGDPTQVIFSDRPLVINILLWIVVCGLMIYIK